MTRSLLTMAVLAASCGLASGQDKTHRPAKAELAAAAVNFTEHVAPIVFANCSSCHRPGEVGPFSLLTYNDVKKKAKLIQQVTEAHSMPPWHPAPGHGEFRNARRLTDTQVSTIKRWVESGSAEGDAKKLPKLPEFTDGWQLGKPDLIVSMDKVYSVPATGRD